MPIETLQYKIEVDPTTVEVAVPHELSVHDQRVWKLQLPERGYYTGTRITAVASPGRDIELSFGTDANRRHVSAREMAALIGILQDALAHTLSAPPDENA